MPDKPPDKSDDQNWGRFATSGMELAAGMGLGAAVGYWIDKKRNSNTPWGILIGFFVGFICGMYLLVKSAWKSNKN